VDVRATLELAPLLAALVWAAALDVRTRRIPNVLTFGLLAAGLARSFMPHAPVSIWGAAAGALAGFGLLLPLFVLNGVGGGDVKLLAATGAWLGPWGILAVFVVETMVGMVFAIAQAIAHGRVGALLRNTVLITVNLAHVRAVGVDHVSETGRAAQPSDQKLHIPWAVPLLIAFVTVCAWKWIGES